MRQSLAVAAVEPGVGGHRHEPGVVLGVVGDVVQEHRQAEPLRPPGATRSRPGGGRPTPPRGGPPSAVLGATSGSVSGSDERNRRHWVSAIGCECTRASASMLVPARPTSTCGTGQHRLVHDRQRRVGEHVVGLGHHTGQRVLDRQHAAGGLAAGDRPHHVRRSSGRPPARRLRIQRAGRLGGVRALLSEMCDGHRSSDPPNKKGPRFGRPPSAAWPARSDASRRVVKAKPKKRSDTLRAMLPEHELIERIAALPDQATVSRSASATTRRCWRAGSWSRRTCWSRASTSTARRLRPARSASAPRPPTCPTWRRWVRGRCACWRRSACRRASPDAEQLAAGMASTACRVAGGDLSRAAS